MPSHPHIPELKAAHDAGRVSRREFLRTATLLGLSSAAAYGMIVNGGKDINYYNRYYVRYEQPFFHFIGAARN